MRSCHEGKFQKVLLKSSYVMHLAVHFFCCCSSSILIFLFGGGCTCHCGNICQLEKLSSFKHVKISHHGNVFKRKSCHENTCQLEDLPSWKHLQNGKAVITKHQWNGRSGWEKIFQRIGHSSQWNHTLWKWASSSLSSVILKSNGRSVILGTSVKWKI